MKISLAIGVSALVGAAAQSCDTCTAFDPTMEWCYDAGGYCLKIGAGCTKTRATCSTAIDCDCQDCTNAFKCGATWALSTVSAYSYTRNAGCKTGKSTAAIQTTTQIKRMDNNRASCLFQKNANNAVGNWVKWTCSDDVGGTATSEQCNDDQCLDCPNQPGVNSVTLVPVAGVCLANVDPNAGSFDYMLTPPAGTGLARQQFEDAMPTCMRDVTVTPVPTPPPAPTPTPATTCSACYTDDSMQWCWDDNKCVMPGATGCTGGSAVATCSNPVDCACSDCDNSFACGGPEPPPPTPDTCEECQTVLRDMEWCWDSPRCLQVGSGCTKTRATCINSVDCDCSDCANSFKCGAPWTRGFSDGPCATYSYTAGSGCTTGKSQDPVLTTNVAKRMDDNRGSCVQQRGPAGTSVWTRWMCSAFSGGSVTATQCTDDECQLCEGHAVIYDVKEVLAKDEGVCLETQGGTTAILFAPPTGSNMNYEDAIAPCLRNLAIPTPAPPPPPPTPSPARTCNECVALDNMEWCWDAADGFAADVLGAGDTGYCLKPGDGCTESRATCSMAIDCKCSDCANSGACGGPGGTWVGSAEIYEYKPTSLCDPKERTPTTPVGHVTKIARMGNPLEMCVVEEDIQVSGQLSLAQNVKYTCTYSGEGVGVPTVTAVACGSSTDCSACKGKVSHFSVAYNENGACLNGAGLLGAKESVQFELPTSTDSGFFAAALAPCMLSPKLPTPAGGGGKDSVGIGVGLGLGLPAAAAAGFFYHKRRTQQMAIGAGGTSLLTTSQLATSQAAGKAELGEMYSQL